MDDNKRKTSNKRWILYGVILSTILIVGIFATLYFVNIDTGDIFYTWEDRSSGELVVIEGTYHGKADTLYMRDYSITDFCSVRFSFSDLTEGVISFYFRYDSDVNGDVTMEFYMGNTIFSDLDRFNVVLLSDTWYLIDLKFDCETDTGEVWIDGIFYTSGAFTIQESDYTNGFVIKTDTTGMIDVCFNMFSIV